MQSDNIAEIKKEDKKVKKKYIVFMIGALLVGFLVGFSSAFFADVFSGGIENVVMTVRNFFVNNASIIGLIMGILTAVATTIIYFRNRKRYTEWDGEDENILEKIEEELSIAILIVNISSIVFLILLAISSVNVLKFTWGSAGLYCAAVVVNLAVELIANNRIVNFSKEINPEKRGSTYDVKFQKKWFDSCDEAERLNIYKASFASYKAVSKTCVVLWIVCLLAMTVIDCGIMPVVLVGVLWLVSNVSYCVEAMRLSKNSSGNVE